MGANTSSAVAQALIDYSTAAAEINGALNNEATRLWSALSSFAATCTEYRTGIGPELAGELRTYVNRTAPTDAWVRQVGQDFAKADGRPLSPWVTTPFAAAGIPFGRSGAAGARSEARVAHTVKGSPRPGPGEALVGSSRSQMRRAAARIIRSNPGHPLGFLLDSRGKFKPQRGLKHYELINRPDLVQMGHITSNKVGHPERLMLEIAWDNQYKNISIETPHIGGAVLDQKAISIGGIAVSKESAKFWQSLGEPDWLKAGTVEAAPVVELSPSDTAKTSPHSNVKGSRLNGTLVRGASRGIFVVGAAIDTYNIATADNKVKESVRVASGWTGAWAGAKGGAAVGAAIGSIFPGPGTLIGGTVGGLLGGAIGYIAGSNLGEKLYDWF